MNKIYKVLGKRGRITIPYEIRMEKGFSYNDILSFEESDDNTVIVKLEKICDGCRAIDGKTDSVPLFNFLDKLNLAEQREALIHLSLKWADSKGGGIHE